MSRIELELYADRLARHAERLRDDVDGARLRLAWAGLEQRVRTDLGAHDAAVLEALGVLVAVDDAGEGRLLERRLRQLQALERLQALVERELADLYPGGRLQSSPPSSSGASDTSMPPSSS